MKSSISVWKEVLQKVDIPLRILHVTRNPFDNFATIAVRGILRDGYGSLNWAKIFESPVSITLVN